MQSPNGGSLKKRAENPVKIMVLKALHTQRSEPEEFALFWGCVTFKGRAQLAVMKKKKDAKTK